MWIEFWEFWAVWWEGLSVMGLMVMVDLALGF